MATAPITRILLVDDHTVLRQGLRMLIENQADLAVVGEAATGEEALEAAARLLPDLVLLDLDLGAETALDIIPAFVALHEGVRVLILTGVRDRNLQLQALRLGAAGIVPKEQAGEVLTEAIRKVHGGSLWVDPSMAHDLIRELRSDRKQPAPDAQTTRIACLTQREREIVSLIAQGVGARGIAALLHISEKTVRNHLASIYDKLDVANRLELALYAVKHRLTAPVP